MLIDEAKLRELGWLKEMPIAKLWGVWTDTGDAYPIQANIIWDGSVLWEYEESGEFNREIWIEYIRGERELETETVLEMGATKQDNGDVVIYIDGKYVDTKRGITAEELEQFFWDAVIEKLKGIASDMQTFIRWSQEDALYDFPLFTTKEEAEKHGLGVKAVIGMAKEVESEGILPDGQDWQDVLHNIGYF